MIFDDLLTAKMSGTIVGHTGFSGSSGGCEHKHCDSPEAVYIVDGKRYCKKHAVRPVKPTSSVGRNDPCPCGSGKKHKKCCKK